MFDKNRRRPGRETVAVPAGAGAATIQWLVRIRWVAVALASLGGALGFKSVLLNKDLVFPFYGAIVSLLLFNVYSTLCLKEQKPGTPKDILAQLLTDMVALSFLLALSGGSRNPFFSLLFIHAGLGAMLLRGRKAMFFFICLNLCLGGLYLLRNIQVISGEVYVAEALPLLSTTASVAVVWFLVSWLSRTLESSREKVDELKEYQNRMDHLRALGALTAELSHQFATPLNTVKMRAERISRRADSNLIREDVAVLLQSVGRCETVLKQIVTAPVDSSSVLLKEIELGEFAANLVSEWSASNGVYGVDFKSVSSTKLFSRVPPVILARSVLNLLDNAAQAGAAPDGIGVTLGSEGISATLCVSDRGPGFPAMVIEQFGRPFITTRAEGTGLGLYNCKSLCEALNGSFHIENREGGGAMAKMVLPLVTQEGT